MEKYRTGFNHQLTVLPNSMRHGIELENRIRIQPSRTTCIVSKLYTSNTYGHLAPEGNKAAVDSLDDEPETATIRNQLHKLKKGLA